ncbi:hypothetical protein I4F81_000718 [Pyropia yezoensis]|uniref:Uncharacterized protein n=1 Tax=Pyropia yezoensis TaxID=2788 RepID=A0ACC3BJH1_PYRYE|nr:hypothetical protein I4F81_000718 [Neopyropia yezoensis]
MARAPSGSGCISLRSPAAAETPALSHWPFGQSYVCWQRVPECLQRPPKPPLPQRPPVLPQRPPVLPQRPP